ncbi:DNA topoisomerase IB [Marixanthomonas ophiurae]|uniref:DNA topoisomerase n=1 Tax=Marixanthomonas ophiurae TaxID=387659 RepID=A0A3E1Q9N8_9FLAO|nr:DNA topoisomerase IB [Marixanthomonas ophiurae]RFN58841.1 DNA topoisomerase IB [Marixanthomonas ophiurae]
MVIKQPDVIKVLEDPTQAAELANLVYITEKKLTIQRHRHGRGFYYTKNGKKIKSKSAIKRFKSLVIPPAWTDVYITPLKNGHLQVVGRDEKKRKQYRYHPHWSQIRNKTKFFKMAEFGKTLPKIRKQIEEDLKRPKMDKRKCLAVVLHLMEETHIRIGNSYYAKKNKSYGLSTMRTKHLEVLENELLFEFVGKKGKEHRIPIKDKRLQKLVLQCEEIPGWELFQYYDEDGDHHSIDSGMVNNYIQEITGDIFSAKDFRTWAASKIVFETLHHLGIEENEKQNKKNILTAYDAAAEGLGNTRTVCREYYVHPVLIEKYEDGSIRSYFEKVDTIKNNKDLLSTSETVLLDLLNEYEVTIN